MPDLPRGTVTFLFTDIEGSTVLWEQDRQVMAEAVTRHIALLEAAIAAHGGVHFKTVGDAVQAAFPTAPAAMAAARAGQFALLAEAWPTGEPLRVRMAMHAGDAAPDAQGDYLAPVLNRLARLLAVGHGGQILLSRAVQQLARGALPEGVTLRDHGEHHLRDLLEPEGIFQLLHPELPDVFPPLRTLDARPNNLPRQPTLFLGREREVRDVVALVQRPEVQFLTLTGPGGTGKTRLALQTAAELVDAFADGVFFVPLASLIDPALVPSAVASVLGIQDVGDRPAAAAVRDGLQNKQLLLVLDNCEHLLDAAPAIGTWLSACPGLKVLATSRAPLRLQAEHEYPVPPLGLPRRKPPPSPEQLSQYEAVRLFITRAQAVRPGFAIDNESAPAIAEICWRLDGLPLAIELAAARIRMLPPQALLARLEQRLPMLTGGARDLPARQRTLRDAIAWSHDLLEVNDQALFARLAVFVGGFTLEAAETVANSDGTLEVFDGVERLCEHSLLRQDDDLGSEPRFILLETIREFGLEQLRLRGVEDATRRQHAQAFVHLAESAEAGLAGPDAHRWLQRLEHDHDNVRTALTWLMATDAEAGLRLATQLFLFWLIRGHLREGCSWLEQTLAAADHVSPSARVMALNALAGLAGPLGDYPRATSAAEAALTLARELDDATNAAWALTILGSLAAVHGDYVRARVLCEEALQLRTENPLRRAVVLTNLGIATLAQGEHTRAEAYLDEALAICQDLGDVDSIAQTTEILAWAAQLQGKQDRAARLLGEALMMREGLGSVMGIAFCLHGFAHVAGALAQWDRAVRLHGAASALNDQIGAVDEPFFQGLYDQALADLRAVIGEDAFTLSWSAGQALAQEAAITEARALAHEIIQRAD